MRPIVFVPLALCLSIPASKSAPTAKSAKPKTAIAKQSAKKTIKKSTAGKKAPIPRAAKETEAQMNKSGANKNSAKHDDHAGHDHGAVPKGAESAVDALWRQADEAFHAGDYEKSIALHKKIVALDPHDSQSYGVAAWLTWSLGRGDEAIAHLRRGVAGDPKNWRMWDELGQNCSLQKRWRDSQDAYTHAVALIPAKEDSQMLRRRLAHAAEKAGDLKTSVAMWRALAKQFPTEAVNRNNLARVEAALANPAASADAPRESEGAPMLLAGGGLLAALLVPALVRR